MKSAWTARVMSLFGGDSPVKDLQSLLGMLGVSGDQGSFDPDSGMLTFDLDLSKQLASRSATIDLGRSLGDLGNFSTTSLVNIAAEAGLKFTVGIDLSNPIGGLFTLSAATPVTALNGTDGVTTAVDPQGRPKWETACG
jgi:hypothetical protein